MNAIQIESRGEVVGTEALAVGLPGADPAFGLLSDQHLSDLQAILHSDGAAIAFRKGEQEYRTYVLNALYGSPTLRASRLIMDEAVLLASPAITEEDSASPTQPKLLASNATVDGSMRAAYAPDSLMRLGQGMPNRAAVTVPLAQAALRLTGAPKPLQLAAPSNSGIVEVFGKTGDLAHSAADSDVVLPAEQAWSIHTANTEPWLLAVSPTNLVTAASQGGGISDAETIEMETLRHHSPLPAGVPRDATRSTARAAAVSPAVSRPVGRPTNPPRTLLETVHRTHVQTQASAIMSHRQAAPGQDRVQMMIDAFHRTKELERARIRDLIFEASLRNSAQRALEHLNEPRWRWQASLRWLGRLISDPLGLDTQGARVQIGSSSVRIA